METEKVTRKESFIDTGVPIVLSSQQQSDIENIYREYLTDIAPFIATLETIDNEYPVEITNEIRAIFTHLARCYTFPNGVDIEAQIVAAKRHIKRAKLDCFKYACLSHAKYIKRFWDEHKQIDLTYIDEGNFVKEIDHLTNDAQDIIQVAKKMDIYNVVLENDLDLHTSDNYFDLYCRSICDDDLFDKYQEAYTLYSQCVEIIRSKSSSINYLVRKSSRKDILSIVSFIVGVVGVLVGIAGIIIAFI